MSDNSNPSSTSTVVRIGMFGGGTVGGGVYELIMGRLGGSTTTTTTTQQPRCIITKICVRDITKPRDFRIDESLTTLTTSPSDILDDTDIDMVIEVMGGTTLAKTVVMTSLECGKSVVTANKALVAEYLEEIHDVIKKQGGVEGKTARFACEAAVCGGIPIISTFQTCYAGDVINEVMGICNGTTNYMLGKMESGAEYDDVLKEAQDLGYAEADPTADVEGYDVRSKIAILAKLAFGTTVSVDDIPCKGITQITSVDFEYAKLLGCTVKLVGTAGRLSHYGEHDGPLSVYVSPKMVPTTHLLAAATGSGNAVAVNSANLGEASYTGPGAGRFPTANSIVADVCRISQNLCPHDPFPLQSTIDVDNDYLSPFYIRISFQDGLGIIRRVGELAERHGVSLNSVLQNPIKDRMAADFVVTTEQCKHSQVMGLCEDIAKEDFARTNPLFMPLLIEY